MFASVGLVRFEHRWLDVHAYRWTRPDPIFERASGVEGVATGESTDRYAYVGNDGINRVDPTGLGAKAAAKAIHDGDGAAAQREAKSIATRARFVTGNKDLDTIVEQVS